MFSERCTALKALCIADNIPEKKSGVSLLTLTFAVLSSSLNRKGVVARLEQVNDFETRFASPGPLFQKVKK